MPIKESRLQPSNQDGLNETRVARVTFDFAVHGGAIGLTTIGVDPVNPATAKSVTLPAKSVIVDCMYDVVTPLTSGGAATISLGAETAADLLAATLISSAGTAGRHDGANTGSAATTTKTTVARNVTLTVGAAALTAGKLVVLIRYIVTA